MEEAQKVISLEELSNIVTPELDRLAELEGHAQALEAELDRDQRYKTLSHIREDMALCEENIKLALKTSGAVTATIQSAGYAAKLTTRHNKGTTTYKIDAIEAQPWGAGCIVKAVNDKVFKAIVEAMSLDITQFAKVEPGTTTLAVSITKEEVKAG